MKKHRFPAGKAKRRAAAPVALLLAVALLFAAAGGLMPVPAPAAAAPAASIEDALGTMDIYFGNMHSHTGYSDGQGTPAEAFAWARDTVGYDFYAITDHGEFLDDSEWTDTGARADEFNQDGSFVAMRGFEWSHIYFGHTCVFGTEQYTSMFQTFLLSCFYDWLVENDGYAQFNHPGDYPGTYSGFKYFNDEYGDRMVATETGNSEFGNNDARYYGFYTQALDKGWRVAPTNNPDNHSLQVNSHRTAVINETLSREGILDAMKARRLYSTDDPNTKVVFKLDDDWMGSEVEREEGTAQFTVAVEDDEEIEKLELVTTGGAVVAETSFAEGSGSYAVEWSPAVDVTGCAYYFLKVTGRDTNGDDDTGSPVQVALTAPIWINLTLEEEPLPAGDWYKGDLHAHSTHSDGDTDVAGVLSIAESKGMDYFALTDHSTADHWDDPEFHSDIMTLLYGVEWTTGPGHANIWSDRRFDWDTLAPTDEGEDAKTAIELAHLMAAQGNQKVLFSMNHPNGLSCEWKYSYEDSRFADCMEVWNARYAWPNLNFLTVQQNLHQRIQDGGRIAMVGGSDSHAHKSDITDPLNFFMSLYHDIGVPTTWVYAASKDGSDILDGLMRGHTCITYSPTGPRVKLWADPTYQEGEPESYEVMMGESVPARALGRRVRFRVTVEGAATSIPSLLSVWKNGVIDRVELRYDSDYSFDFVDVPREGDYYRAQVNQITADGAEDPIMQLLQLTQLGWVVGVSNPIFTVGDDLGVTGVTPASAYNDGTVSITELEGTGFENGASVELRKDGETPVVSTGVTVESDEKITCDIDLAGVEPGAWDVVVINPNGWTALKPGAFEVLDGTVPSVTSITPPSGTNDGPVSVTDLAGTGFLPGAAAELRMGGETPIVATGLDVVSPVKMTCTFDLAGAKPGAWDVAVVNLNGRSGSKASAFTVSTKPAAPEPPSPKPKPNPKPKPTAPEPASTWYLPEGSTDWGFDCYISVANPNASAVKANVTYMPAGMANVTSEVTLPANSRTTLNPRDSIGSADFSTKVECADDQKKIAVDRTMTWTGKGALSLEAHNSVGVNAPANLWYLPEGSSAWGFETWLLIQNPNSTEADCTVTYMIEGEDPRVVNHPVGPNTRATFNMETDIGKKDASIQVESPVPVIPERAMYRNDRREGHDSIGTTTAAASFYLAEGTTDWGFTTYVLVQNPNDAPVEVNVTYMTPSGPVQQPVFVMRANSRKTIRVNDIPAVSKTDLSTQVRGTLPIIAERAMYWNNGTGEACHDSIGMASPHMTFYLPDGQAGPGVETWTLVQNPNDTDVKITVTYLPDGGGTPLSLPDTVPANSRRTYFMADSIPDGKASIVVTSDSPGRRIMAERAMYWNNRGAGANTIGGYK